MRFEKYPFEKLNELLLHVKPNEEYREMVLTIGEPQLKTPNFIQKSVCENIELLNRYPKSAGEEFLKESMIEFFRTRFSIELKMEQIVPVFGTREALFNLPQFLLFDKISPKMAFTNPFYQIYEGAAIASGAKPIYLDLKPSRDFKVSPDPEVLKNCDLVVLNFPNNPTGAVLDMDELKEWVLAALEYDFVLINDECYSEIYDTAPPPSLLNAAREVGNDDYRNVLVVNSLSKRSSAPGLRSGFVAGDEKLLKEYMRYRTYLGCASPLPLQYGAAAAWRDSSHVTANRDLYRNNFKLAKEILNIAPPKATFYLWLEVGDDLEFTKRVYGEYNLKVLPGRFLGRNGAGEGYIRAALVYEPAKTKEALNRLKEAMKGN